MNQERIGKFIATLRKEKKLTQEQLAEKLGVASKSISRWENGKYMPDLSLLKPLSEILGVTINELMSGERIDEKNYQEQFEENVVNAISDVDNSNKVWNLITYVIYGIIALIVILFIGNIIFTSVEFTQKYDANNMKFEKYEENSNNKQYMFKTTYSGCMNKIITTYKDNNTEVGIIFVNFTRTLEQYTQDKHSFKNVDLTLEKYSYGQGFSLKDSKIPSEFKVYYTTTSFKKIAKANNDELLKIIESSDLIYESE